MARDRMIRNRVWFFDEMPQVRLRLVYSAANALVLASEREGWPNVLLEAAACGTPVVAFPVGGIPEMLGDLELGVMVRGAHDAVALSDAIRRLLVAPPSRDAVRAAAVRFAWEPVLEEQMALYRRAAGPEEGVSAKPDFEPARA